MAGWMKIPGVCVAGLVLAACGFAQTWVENSFTDFADGTLDAAGQGLYVTAAGKVKTIHRFDLNADGYLDLVFNSSHDFVTGPPATLYTLPAGRREGKVRELPVRGSRRAAVADLNKDGFLDAVLCPNNDWATSRRYMFIFWGDKQGWSARRMTNLITIDPRALAITDLDGDGWLDILVLNGTRWAPEDGREKILRIYWGSEESFKQEHYKDVVLDGAKDLVADDLDADGRTDLVILQSSPSAVDIYWNDRLEQGDDLPEPSRVSLEDAKVSKLRVADLNRDGRKDLIVAGGRRQLIGRDPTTGEERYRYSGLMFVNAGQAPRQWTKPVVVDAPPASAFAVGDVDGDGWTDVALAESNAHEESVRILWGDPEGQFKARERTTLPIGRVSALAIDDLDGDGSADVVAGVFRAKQTYDAFSRIFYGDGNGGFRPGEEIPTAAVNSVTVAHNDAGDGRRLIFCNNIQGRINEDVPVRVFWGAKDGFAPERFDSFHIRSGLVSSAADLNDDGYADLVLASIVHNVKEPHPERGFNILWGGKDGLKDDRRTIVPEHGLQYTNVADLDRDGYLDLVGSCDKPSEKGESARVVVWHGGSQGFDPERRMALPCEGGGGPNVVADFNRDGHLDIAVSHLRAHRISIFWGSSQGFSKDRRRSWPFLSADDMQAADLDGDGWLELVATSYSLPGTLNYDFGTRIYWGGPEGFDPTNAQRLPGSAGCGISVADYDADGRLDLFVPNYKLTETREAISAFLFWGSAAGFSELNRTELMIDSGSGTLSADFNRDGLIDLAVSAHSRDGNHFVDSRVYYNDGKRFADPRLVRLPTVGSHYMQRADAGHVYDRSYRQAYTSSVFTWEEARTAGTIRCTEETPGDSRLELAVRSAPSAKALDQRPWLPLAPAPGTSAERAFPVDATDRCVQYRAIFISDNGDRYPTLDSVKVKLLQ